VYPAPPGSLVRVDPSPVRIVHLVSRHPSHTPLTPEESKLLSNCKVYVHAHGPGAWTQECIDYAASLLGLTAPPTLLCNSRYTFQNLRLPYGWQSTIIPLPLRPSYSPYSRYEDREHTSSLVRSGPRPDPKRNWCIYTGRCSPEKNLPALSHLCSQAGIELLIATADVPSVSCYHIPWTDDLTRIYNAADFCICTSTSEGGPIFAAEALLQGCTVLSTPVGHMPDLLPPARILHSLEAVPDILRRPHSLERSSEDIILAFHAAKFFASSLLSGFRSRDKS
jgi:glycosyltransferase involved in cell wall biosynthesis